jgi:hypothetical protein
VVINPAGGGHQQPWHRKLAECLWAQRIWIAVATPGLRVG